MSYRIYPCDAWMIPATLENAKKIGILEEEINRILGVGTEDPWDEDEWDEALENIAYDENVLKGCINGIDFTVRVTYISFDDEIDDEMDPDIRSWFTFFDTELFTPTPLKTEIDLLGVEYHSWVTGG